MPSILVLDEDAAFSSALAAGAGRRGWHMVQADSSKRLVLEMRAAAFDVIVARQDMKHGSGLDLVRDAYRAAEKPLPVVAYSARGGAEELLADVPLNLLLVALLSDAPSADQVLETLAWSVDGFESGVAAAGGDAAGRELPGRPALLVEGGPDAAIEDVPMLLAAVHRAGWSGMLSFAAEADGAILCGFRSGQLNSIGSKAGGDLIATARLEGRLDGVMLPEVALSGEDEEIGLLMAMRAISPHEAPALKERNRSRLLSSLLALGETEAQRHAPAVPESSSALPLLPSLVRFLAGQEQHFYPLASASVELVLPPGSHRGFEGVEQRLMRQLEAYSPGTRIGAVLDAAGSDREALIRLLGVLRRLAYLITPSALFADEVSQQLAEMVGELHRWSRTDCFGVLGVGPQASDREVRDRMRKLSMLYHPDRLLDAHPRVAALAELMYARVQEVFAEVETGEARSAYREQLRAREEGAGAGSDANQARVAMAQASILVKQKRYGDAAALYRDATLHDDSNADAHMGYGWCRYLDDSSRVADAVISLERALELNPRSRDAWFYLGRVQLLEKHHDKARACFLKANTERISDAEAVGHAGAARELRLMDSRGLGLPDSGEPEGDAKAERGGGGLFGLFRRG
ncbi:MAG: hypothetical protein CMP23_13430 [Rickettsiales bacterium]|nr:hypothetical protein [Rickettsiales bacterium]